MNYIPKKKFGQVFTPQKEVLSMLEMLEEMHYASRVLEPGCGTGNFLIEAFNRKIDLLMKLPEVRNSLKSNFIDEFEWKFIIAVSSIYGIDIDKDVIEIAKEKCKNLLTGEYLKLTKTKLIPEYMSDSINYLLNKNILTGDILQNPEEIIINEYSEVLGMKIKIREFRYADLIFPDDEVFENQTKLFVHIPEPIREHNPVSYKKVASIG